jgi:hypothetical protein
MQCAIHTLRLATKMVNQNLVTVAEDRGKAHAPQTLAFQPVEVRHRTVVDNIVRLQCIWF